MDWMWYMRVKNDSQLFCVEQVAVWDCCHLREKGCGWSNFEEQFRTCEFVVVACYGTFYFLTTYP